MNEKFRENVPAWNSFERQREKFPAFFARVLGLLGAGDALQHMHERVTYILFIIHAFQSLEQEAVRAQALKLVSLPLWHALSRGRLQVHPFASAPCCHACCRVSWPHPGKPQGCCHGCTCPGTEVEWSAHADSLCGKCLCAAGAADA